MFLSNTTDTILFGKDLAQKLKPKSILLLKGQIGAGKTTLVKGIAEGLGIKDDITSPTFALSHHYYTAKIELIHMDLYRIENADSAKELFLQEEEELDLNNGIIIIEWPELVQPIIDSFWLIEINYNKNSGRELKIYEPKVFKS